MTDPNTPDQTAPRPWNPPKFRCAQCGADFVWIADLYRCQERHDADRRRSERTAAKERPSA